MMNNWPVTTEDLVQGGCLGYSGSAASIFYSNGFRIGCGNRAGWDNGYYIWYSWLCCRDGVPIN